MQIIIDMDQVVIEGTPVPRPVYISRSQWIGYWERCSRVKIIPSTWETFR